MEQEDSVRDRNRSPEDIARRKPRGAKAPAKSNRSEPPAQGEGLLSRIVDVVTGRASETEDKAPEDDPVKMLERDHRKVEALFEAYENAGEGARARRKEIVEQIANELEIHAQLEERIFYQAFKSVRPEEPKKLVRESFEEHKIVKTLLAELSALEPTDEQFDAKVTVLKESVEHHVEEEEDDLFPEAKKLLGDEGLREIAGRMRELKVKLQAKKRD
ncbi:MAG: hemerythrin domain-containing protein [Acidobacteria bacterium]|nr:hemerythrin domain-containing protein [Acidobacteriota bacterium]MCA1612048.1 hemerythrin domain-containing protein [Acidobacteriota bacterium]